MRITMNRIVPLVAAGAAAPDPRQCPDHRCA
ncbi:MAG: hypothetical protein QOF47_397, partial [Mycobacterium sp.]|nr:hypothetical protein [Mycobacterium sp.]